MDSMADGQGRRLGDGGKRWQPITFADVEVGDEIKSVSPCGTVRKGVVTRIVDRWSLADRDWWVIGKPEWTLYRRAPNPAKFVPLDVPEVGQWIEAEFRNGDAEAFQVTGIQDVDWPALVCLEGRAGGGRGAFINLQERAYPMQADILSWRPIDPPAPAEPTGFGYVGTITDDESDVWDLHRTDVRGSGGRPMFIALLQGGNAGTLVGTWERMLNVGTFTAVTK